MREMMERRRGPQTETERQSLAANDFAADELALWSRLSGRVVSKEHGDDMSNEMVSHQDLGQSGDEQQASGLRARGLSSIQQSLARLNAKFEREARNPKPSALSPQP